MAGIFPCFSGLCAEVSEFGGPDTMLNWFFTTSISEIRDIGDEHSAISATIVRLACERAEAHDFERLQGLARALVLATTAEERAPADSRFHIELAVSAQSPRLTDAEIRLQNETVQQLWTPLATTPNPESATAEHLELGIILPPDGFIRRRNNCSTSQPKMAAGN